MGPSAGRLGEVLDTECVSCGEWFHGRTGLPREQQLCLRCTRKQKEQKQIASQSTDPESSPTVPLSAFCYPSVPILCGECSWVMDTADVTDRSQRPFKYRAVCQNKECGNHGIVYSLESLRIPLQRES